MENGTRERLLRMIRGELIERLHSELKLFKESASSLDKDSISQEFYRVEAFISLYEVLEEQAGKMPESVLSGMEQKGTDILLQLYRHWMEENGLPHAERDGAARERAEGTKKHGKGDEDGRNHSTPAEGE